MNDGLWNWVREDVVFAIHDEQLAEHGGRPGIRDSALVRSALARPQNLAAYANPDAAELAASYAFGIARDHGFVDGNKRTAFVVASVFLLDHGYDLVAADSEIIKMMLALAAGEATEADIATWFRTHAGSTEP